MKFIFTGIALPIERAFLPQTLLVMKLTTILSLAFCLQASAHVNAQSITLSKRHASLEAVFKEIRKQTGYEFLYNNPMLEKAKIQDVQIDHMPVNEALDLIFREQPLVYTLIGKTIVVKDKSTGKDPDPTTVIQLINVKGTVVDSVNNTPLPGVTVQVKGGTAGTATDQDGKFSLSVPADAILLVSYVGYDKKEIAVNGRQVIVIRLATGKMGLDEVVVVGYGTETKASITGAISQIKSKEINSISTSNLVTGLAGKLPGLRVTQRTGEPGAFSTAFDIRGFGTPLIVVDGIVRKDFDRLDPNSIESITVLKDASAAVYGVQAANGVILVTTKKGVIGTPQINYSGNYEFQKFTNVPQVGDAYQFAVLTTENEIAMGKSPGTTTYSPDDIKKFQDGTYPSTNWLDAIARKNTNLMHHNVSVTGGNDRIRYFSSLGYLGETGVWKSGDLGYKKYNVQSSVTANITDNLTAQLNIDGAMEDRYQPSLPANNIFFTAMLAQPVLPLYANNNPEYLQLVNPENVMADAYADKSGYAKTKTKTFQGNFNLEYKFKKIEGLTAKFMYGFYNQDVFEKDWRQKYFVYNYDKLSDTYSVAGSGKWTPSSLYENYSPLQKSTVLGQLTYERSFLTKHHLKAAVVYEERHEKSDNIYANKEFDIDVDQLYAGNSQNAQVSSANIYENANQSVIGRINYDFASKYLLEVGANYGGSSKFPKGARWGLFPFVSAGWRISEEKFIKDNLPEINNLKLRASWGKMGDDGAADFQFLTGYNYPEGNYVFGNDVLLGLGFRGLPNPNITWFTATSKNIGVDVNLFNDLVSFQFDFFQRDRSGLLATRALSIPSSVGANLPQENLNEDRRKGFEVVLGHKKRIGEFIYDVSANLTYTRGENIYIERAGDGNTYLNWRNNTTARWDNIQWGYKYIGQFQTAEEILSSPQQDGQGNRTLRPGDLKYEDLNHDGIINDMDQAPIARGSIPDINFGLNINLAWKNFDVNILFQGAANYNYRYDGMNSDPIRWGRNGLTQFMDRWHHEDIYDVNSPWVPGYYPPTGYVPSDTWTSSYWLGNASYLRLKSMEIGYTISKAMLKRVGIQNLRVHASGFNLHTWTNLKNMDPEQVSDFFYSYPITQNLSLGLNVTF